MTNGSQWYIYLHFVSVQHKLNFYLRPLLSQDKTRRQVQLAPGANDLLETIIPNIYLTYGVRILIHPMFTKVLNVWDEKDTFLKLFFGKGAEEEKLINMHCGSHGYYIMYVHFD